MTAPDPLGPAATIAALSSTTHPLGDLTTLPAASGLYAWWAAPEILPHLPGPAHPHQVQVTVTDTATGDILIDEPRTTYDNGFLGFWLRRDITATLTIDYDDKSATVPIATGDLDLTCLTTMRLT